MKTSFDPRTRAGRFTLALVGALMLGVSAIPRQAPDAARAYEERVAAAEALEQSTVDQCNAAIKFEHPRAKPGLTRVARTLPDGSFLAEVPFTVGKRERMARCVGRPDGSLEFGVQTAVL